MYPVRQPEQVLWKKYSHRGTIKYWSVITSCQIERVDRRGGGLFLNGSYGFDSLIALILQGPNWLRTLPGLIRSAQQYSQFQCHNDSSNLKIYALTSDRMDWKWADDVKRLIVTFQRAFSAVALLMPPPMKSLWNVLLYAVKHKSDIQ